MSYRERARQEDRERTWGRNRSVVYGAFSGKGPRGYFRSDERIEEAPDDSEAQGMASWGQGDRGAEGYYDHGESELQIGRGDEERYE